MHDDPHEGGAHGEDREHVVVVAMGEVGHLVLARRDVRAEQRRGGHAEPVAASRHVIELEGETPQHLREGHGEDAEEDLRVAHAHEAEEGRDERRRDDAAHHQHLEGRDLEVLDEQGHRVGAHAEIGGVSEGEQSRVAQQEIEAEGGDGHDKTVGEQRGLVRLDQPREEREGHEERDDPAQHAKRRQGERAHGRPKTPAGRISSTTAAMR